MSIRFSGYAKRFALAQASRGLEAEQHRNTGPVSPVVVERLKQLGIVVGKDMRGPMQAERGDFEQANILVALKEAEHRPMIARHFSGWEGRVEYWQVDDLDCAGPETALACIESAVKELVSRLECKSRHSSELISPDQEANPRAGQPRRNGSQEAGRQRLEEPWWCD